MTCDKGLQEVHRLLFHFRAHKPHIYHYLNSMTGSHSPSLLLQEKPKQSRNTSTIEIHIIATDALADLVNTGASSDRKKYDKRHMSRNPGLVLCIVLSYAVHLQVIKHIKNKTNKLQTVVELSLKAEQHYMVNKQPGVLFCFVILRLCSRPESDYTGLSVKPSSKVKDTVRLSHQNLTLRIQFLQVCCAADRVHHPRLTHCTLHLPTLPPLLGAQGIIASGSVGPVWILLSSERLRKGCAVLNPGHGHLLWVETLQVTVKSERTIVGACRHSRKSNRGEI